MKVLLLNPPFVKNFMRNARWAVVGISGSEWYPIYLGYCTGLLEKKGHQVKLLDAQNRGLSHEQTYQIAQEFKPEFLVLYFSTASLENDIAVGEKIKGLTGCQVVMVGPWASIYPKRTLKKAKNIDMLAEGEFDFTVLEIANKIPKGKIKGLYYKKGNKIIKNPPRPPVPAEELDKFPFLTDVYRRHLNIWDYHQTGHQYPFVDLFTGRGCCWGLCTFCLWPNTINKGAGYRKRSKENVIEELKFIKKEMPYIKEVFFQDDTLPKDRAIELSEAILKNNLKMCWSCYSRPNLDFETLKLMKRAGCRTMHVGYESGDLKILKAIRKGTTPQIAERFTYDAAKAGLFIVADFITGLPYETVETIKKTTEWAKRLPVQRYTITLPKPYPKTPFYDWLKKNDYINEKGEVNYPELSWEEINKWNRWSIKYVYLSKEFFFRMVTKPYEWVRLLRSAFYFFPYLFSRKKQREYSGIIEPQKLKEEKVLATWNSYWKNYQGVTKIGAWSQKLAMERALTIVKESKLKKTAKIIDVGCGEGRSLKAFRQAGFNDSIGVDSSQQSLALCQKNGSTIGKDVFLQDARRMKYKDESFDLVFSEGLLEHFKYPEPIIREMTRISRRFVLLIQPNHFSFYGLTIAILGHFLRSNVREHTFPQRFFVNRFSHKGFLLKKKKYTPLREFFILLFEKEKG